MTLFLSILDLDKFLKKEIQVINLQLSRLKNYIVICLQTVFVATIQLQKIAKSSVKCFSTVVRALQLINSTFGCLQRLTDKRTTERILKSKVFLYSLFFQTNMLLETDTINCIVFCFVFFFHLSIAENSNYKNYPT